MEPDWNRCQTKPKSKDGKEEKNIDRVTAMCGHGGAGLHRDVLCETERQARVACSCVSDPAEIGELTLLAAHQA